jgi:hypothetical protein
VNKWVFIASVLSRMAGRILFVSLLFIGLFSFLMLLSGQPVSFIGALSQVIQNKIYQLFLIVAVLFNTRLILFRLRDRDPAGTS